MVVQCFRFIRVLLIVLAVLTFLTVYCFAHDAVIELLTKLLSPWSQGL